jgi:hypothetical protein
MAWYRLAKRRHMNVDECMASTSSTEFIQWIEVINKEEWEENTKRDYFDAAIAYEIRRISCQLGGGQLPKFEEFLFRFKARKSGKPVTKNLFEGIKPGDFDKATGATEVIDVGVTPLNDEWKAITAQAKAEWLACLPPQAIISYTG